MNWQLLNKMMGMQAPEEAEQMNEMDREMQAQEQASLSDEELRAKLIKEIQEKLKQSQKYAPPREPNNLNTPGLPRG